MNNTEEKFEKITDFKALLECIKDISDLDYQESIWVRHDDSNIVDSYDDTSLNFLEDGEAVLNAYRAGRVVMSEIQFKNLTRLYKFVDAYDSSEERPDADCDIVKDPKWVEISEYAKEVYKVLTEG